MADYRNKATAVRGIWRRVQDGKYFVIQRIKDGTWEFAGGKTDNQPLLVALHREFQEETGLKFDRALYYKTVYNRKTNYYTAFYIIEQAYGEIKLQPDEVTDYRFVSKKELRGLRLSDDTKLVLGFKK